MLRYWRGQLPFGGADRRRRKEKAPRAFPAFGPDHAVWNEPNRNGCAMTSHLPPHASAPGLPRRAVASPLPGGLPRGLEPVPRPSPPAEDTGAPTRCRHRPESARPRWPAPARPWSACRSAPEDARSAATLGRERQRLGRGDRPRRPGPHHRLPDPRGRRRRPRRRQRPRAPGAPGGLRPRHRLRPGAGPRAAAAQAGAARRTAATRATSRCWSPAAATTAPQLGPAGVAPAVLRLLGVPHRRRAVHLAAAHHHSGAALFNAEGELLGIGSLFVADALGKATSGCPATCSCRSTC